MVLEKSEPALARIRRRGPWRQVAGDRGLGDFESQFQQLAVDPGSTPSRILLRHRPDQMAKLSSDLWSAGTAARKQAPVPPEPGAMPADDGLRLHDHQHARPFGPPTAEAEPEQTTPKAQAGSGVLALEDADLLSQGNQLQSQFMSRAEEGTEPRKRRQKKPDHGSSLHDTVDRKIGSCKWLILRSNRIFEDTQVALGF